MKVSVIVPVYNGEKTIADCLDTLAAQTLPELEVLAVDDCSTDGTADILREYEARHPGRIRTLRTAVNSGAGGARNLGLSQAQGEYVGYADADDIVAPAMYEKLYAAAKEADADFADSGYYNEEKDIAMLHTADEQTGELDDEKRSALIVSGGYIVSRIFRKAFLLEKGIPFREKAILEDSEFLTRIYATAERCTSVKEIFYKYRYYPDSASREQDPERYVGQLAAAMEANYRAVCELANYEGLRTAVDYAVIQMYDYGVVMSLKAYQNENGRNRAQVKRLLKKLRAARQKTARPGYDNPYVRQKISRTDILLMQKADQSPDAAIALLPR